MNLKSENHNNMKHLLITLITLFSVIQYGNAQTLFQESDGMVIIEMESTFGQPLGEWVPGTSVDPENQTGTGYLKFTGNDPEQGPPISPLEYVFKINKGGVYSLHLHCAKLNLELNGRMRNDVCNDAYVRVDGNYQARNPQPDDFPDAEGEYRKEFHKQDAPLDLLKVNTKFYGGEPQKFVWTQMKNSNGSASESLDPGGHNNKRGAYYRLLAGETYRLTIHGRSRDFMINRILFRHEDTPFSAATDLSNPESATINAEPFPKMDHRLTVKNGFGNGHYAAGQKVSLRAAPAPEGMIFDAWTGDIASVTDATSAETSLEMPETDLTLLASYKRDPSTQYKYTFSAVTDFADIASGEIPYYIDKQHKALAINAAKKEHRGPFARAIMTFEGAPDVYNVTITTIGEEDGDCVYRFFVNDECVGKVSNKSTEKAFETQSHSIALSVEIPVGATLAVESSAVTNGKIPEGDGTAWARGRWTGLTLQSDENASSPKRSDRFRHAAFNKSRDLLLIQYDGRPDADDVHAQAAAGSLLNHKDMAGINTYAVHNAWGKQKSKDIWNSETLMTLAFGPENIDWTNAYTLENEHRTDTSSNWYQSVQRIADRVQPILESGGTVWVAEAGQSDITKDWVVELLDRGISSPVVKSGVIIVQHSQWNEDQTSPGVLKYLKKNTTYIHIDDGNDGNNETPNYHTDKDAASIAVHAEIRKKAVSPDNPVEATRSMWMEAAVIIGDWGKGYSQIDEGGFDFSDTVEVWWILDLGEAVDTIPEFADAYIFDDSGSQSQQ
jgi:hypothetical protein